MRTIGFLSRDFQEGSMPKHSKMAPPFKKGGKKSSGKKEMTQRDVARKMEKCR